MAELHDLPPELMRNVFAFVRQKKDLRNVCLVNWAFHKLAAPFLWESFTTNLE
ncbi:hypothetical protein NX059_001402 [Plenodomus lindquistii]|nr:hypothetical protein NX059_001402 [Plenodomus lindquistii]